MAFLVFLLSSAGRSVHSSSPRQDEKHARCLREGKRFLFTAFFTIASARFRKQGSQFQTTTRLARPHTHNMDNASDPAQNETIL